MSRKVVKSDFDPSNPPALTDAEKMELDMMNAQADDRVDYSDIPPLTEEFWKNRVRNPHFRPTKKQLTLRLDADIVAWFKHRTSGERGYQTRINNALREYVEQEEKKAG